MDVEGVKEYILDYSGRELPALVERSLKLDGTQKIKAIIGPRRAGKTCLMKQEMKKLLAEGVKREEMLYLNFEDTRISDINYKEIREMVKIHWQLFPGSINEKMYLFIDEPQNVRNWENAVRALHDEGFIIYLSGSSSKLLSREIATALRGRSLSYKLLPFSFAEFLRSRNASFDPERLSSRDKASLLGLFDEYAEYGGFPEVTSEKDPENRIRILDDYLNLTVYKDVVERHRIKNIAVIKWLIKTFLTSYAREHSIHKTYLILKSRGLKTSKNTLYSYVSMLEDALFIFTVPKYATSERKRDFSINKTYLCDTGYAKLAGGTKDRGYRMENIVFLELERRKKPLQAITYWKNAQQEEVDFAIQEGQTTTALIQVCENAADEKTRHREVRALLKAGKELNCKNLQIITADHETEETANRKKIEYTPIWKWLLKNSQKK